MSTVALPQELIDWVSAVAELRAMNITIRPAALSSLKLVDDVDDAVSRIYREWDWWANSLCLRYSGLAFSAGRACLRYVGDGSLLSQLLYFAFFLPFLPELRFGLPLRSPLL